jgi:positive regulator of sigma E activity
LLDFAAVVLFTLSAIVFVVTPFFLFVALAMPGEGVYYRVFLVLAPAIAIILAWALLNRLVKKRAKHSGRAT